jgi:hypothetical protein
MPERAEKPILTPQARLSQPGLPVVELAAGALALIWVVALVASYLGAPEGSASPGLAMVLVLLVLPLALIAAAVVTLRSIRDLRAEAAQLRASVDALRQAQATGAANPAATKLAGPRKSDDPPAPVRQAEPAAAAFTSRRDAGLTVPSADRSAVMVTPDPAAAGEEQPGLALGTPADALAPPLPLADVIRALQFPENPEDAEGFRALRSALEDREVAKLIRAAQDVLTLLSQDGIYMDDLRPDMARPELWRRFAAGERGKGVAAVGGVRDRAALALTASRMREDPVFRDAGHHFLRTFDRLFQQFEHSASDSEIVALAETRTARAFMLFGRVMGVFD